ncbi:MAG: hypothetical protein AAFV25_09485, partial [Bacteroidota bacterium]
MCKVSFVVLVVQLECAFQFLTNGTQNSSMRVSGLWISGFDLADNLKGAFQLYNKDNKADFAHVPKMNKIWKVTRQ